MELWLVSALLTVVLYGLGEGLSKEPTVRLGSARMLVLYALANVPIYVAWFFIGRGWEAVTPVGFALAVASGVSGCLGTVFWFRAMESGTASVVSGFSAAYPVITVAAAVMILGATLVPLQIVAIFFLMIGAVLLGIFENPGRTGGGRTWLVPMLLAITLWGAWGIFEKLAIDSVGYAANAGVYAVVSTPIFLLMARGRSKPGAWDRKSVVAAQPALALFAVAGITTYLAIGMGPLAIVVPLTTAYPLVAILFRRLWHAERMTRPQTAAVACALLGALLVSL